MFNQEMQKLGEARSIIREIFEYGNRRKAEIGEENVFDFSIGNPSAPPPAAITEELLRLLTTMPPEKLHGYSSAAGLWEVREAVAAYIREKFGVPMRGELVYMTYGAAAALSAIFSALIAKEGEEIIVPAPFFPEYTVFVRQAGGVLVPVMTDAAFHLDIGAIAAAITPKTRAVLLNSPNNPTGAVYAEQELRSLAEMLQKCNMGRENPIFLICDEPYRSLCYGEEPVYPMAVYPHTVVCDSFSKSLSLAGERIGYIAVSPQCEGAEAFFSAVMGAGRALGYVCAPTLFQRAVAGCLGQVSDLAAYRENRDLLYEALCGMGYECVKPEGAFYLFVKSLEPDAAAFCARAREHELLLVPSDSFGIGGYVRISYCVKRETIQGSLPAFAALAKSYTK